MDEIQNFSASCNCAALENHKKVVNEAMKFRVKGGVNDALGPIRSCYRQIDREKFKARRNTCFSACGPTETRTEVATFSAGIILSRSYPSGIRKNIIYA